MANIKVLYVASEVGPFLGETEVADLVKRLLLNMEERGVETRIIVPKFGVINERKSRLHEVVRLSGINIPVGKDEKPLLIKVASISKAKLQVYFIDNEDYFYRKGILFDKKGNFYDDNDERIIFFCKAVLETVKKLGWSPDIIHCNGWITSLIPLYAKTIYKKDPIFQDAKTIFSVYNNKFEDKFGDDLLEKVKGLNMKDDMLTSLKTKDYDGFIKLGMEYADTIVNADEENTASVDQLIASLGNKKVATIKKNENFEESYYHLYNELISNKKKSN